MTHTQSGRALCLLSGGLDSILAARVLLDQDVDVHALAFITPFFGSDKAEKAAHQLNIPIRIIEITDDFLTILRSPRYGFGQTMNPCIDCHTLMIREAGKIMEREGYDLIATGEVLGERPMSQNRQSLKNIALHSGYQDYVLRPLSALLLEPTQPERNGTIERNRLLGLSGRSRKAQIALARKYSITDYPQPASGCLLTDRLYSLRLRELLAHSPVPEHRELELLRLGRHLRLPSSHKAVISRNEIEGVQILSHYRAGDAQISLEPLKGPIALILNGGTEQDAELTAGACLYYSKYRGNSFPVNLMRGENRTVIQSAVTMQDQSQLYLITDLPRPDRSGQV
ncbi:tRNA 4-thiouridine(8) synthase ThiI [bacterium]|nr:tRNA 4-thiouridine(8) synthase ThiI [bacterium]